MAGYEEKLKSNIETLETMKKEYFFPQSAMVMGSGGIYLGLDDLWLEVASGYFVVDLIPLQKYGPALHVVLSGSPRSVLDITSGGGSGITLKIRLEGVKTAGDKGKNIPKLEFDSVDVVMVVKASLQLSFDMTTSEWHTTPNAFQLEVLSFKGPYGITKRWEFK